MQRGAGGAGGDLGHRTAYEVVAPLILETGFGVKWASGKSSPDLAEAVRLSKNCSFWVHIWGRTLLDVCTSTLLTHRAATRSSRKNPFPATSLQHPLWRKPDILHTIKERCFKNSVPYQKAHIQSECGA